MTDAEGTPSPCTLCGHGGHPGKPCATCATGGSTCWQPVIVDAGDGVNAASGHIEMATGIEERPCVMCRSFEKDISRLIRHLLTRGLTMATDGTFTTPIAKDFVGRNSLKIDPKSWGFCRRQTMPVDMLASCSDWSLVRTREDLISRIK